MAARTHIGKPKREASRSRMISTTHKAPMAAGLLDATGVPLDAESVSASHGSSTARRASPNLHVAAAAVATSDAKFSLAKTPQSSKVIGGGCDDTCYLSGGSDDSACRGRIVWVRDNEMKSLGAAIAQVNHECKGQCACAPTDFTVETEATAANTATDTSADTTAAAKKKTAQKPEKTTASDDACSKTGCECSWAAKSMCGEWDGTACHKECCCKIGFDVTRHGARMAKPKRGESHSTMISGAQKEHAARSTPVALAAVGTDQHAPTTKRAAQKKAAVAAPASSVSLPVAPHSAKVPLSSHKAIKATTAPAGAPVSRKVVVSVAPRKKATLPLHNEHITAAAAAAAPTAPKKAKTTKTTKTTKKAKEIKKVKKPSPLLRGPAANAVSRATVSANLKPPLAPARPTRSGPLPPQAAISAAPVAVSVSSAALPPTPRNPPTPVWKAPGQAPPPPPTPLISANDGTDGVDAFFHITLGEKVVVRMPPPPPTMWGQPPSPPTWQQGSVIGRTSGEKDAAIVVRLADGQDVAASNEMLIPNRPATTDELDALYRKMQAVGGAERDSKPNILVYIGAGQITEAILRWPDNDILATAGGGKWVVALGAEMGGQEASVTRDSLVSLQGRFAPAPAMLRARQRYVARQSLLVAQSAMDSMRVPFWLAKRTLLGVVRHCDLFAAAGEGSGNKGSSTRRNGNRGGGGRGEDGAMVVVSVGVHILDWSPGVVDALAFHGLRLVGTRTRDAAHRRERRRILGESTEKDAGQGKGRRALLSWAEEAATGVDYYDFMMPFYCAGVDMDHGDEELRQCLQDAANGGGGGGGSGGGSVSGQGEGGKWSRKRADTAWGVLLRVHIFSDASAPAGQPRGDDMLATPRQLVWLDHGRRRIRIPFDALPS